MRELYDTWLFRIIVNFYGYGFVLVPLFLFVKFYKSQYPLGLPGNTCYTSFVRIIVYGRDEELPTNIGSAQDEECTTSNRSTADKSGDSVFDLVLRFIAPHRRQAAKLVFCFLGLQVCYVTWGYFQERVMTIRYNFETPKLAHGFQPQREAENPWRLSADKILNGTHAIDVKHAQQGKDLPAEIDQNARTGEYFRDSQFLVFANRVCALLLSGIILLVRARSSLAGGGRASRNRLIPVAAAYKYSYPSMTNTLSSWFQYEALKYVSFPTQVICKSAKMVATMFMSKLVSSVTRSRKVSYTYFEWVTACAISIGVCFFLLGSEYEEFKARAQSSSVDTVATEGSRLQSLSGAVILIGYLVSDSFTTTYQSSLFSKYKVSSVGMMFAVNAFSFACCGVSLICQSAFSNAWRFIAVHPDFLVHIAVVSFTSALGQLFIFYTIDQFGAVTFALIMTARQAFSIVISCITFSHPVTLLGWFGLLIAIAATLVRSRSTGGSRSRSRQMADPTAPTSDRPVKQLVTKL